jgi:hypothetical protein
VVFLELQCVLEVVGREDQENGQLTSKTKLPPPVSTFDEQEKDESKTEHAVSKMAAVPLL